MTAPFICDPRKNTECSKTGCYLHGGECFSTQNAAYAWTETEIMNLPTPSEPIASAEIKIKLPSLNEYIRVCRANKYEAAEFKRTVERQIGFYIDHLPVFMTPVRIDFTWIEETKRRDYDNVCAAKKFILDALVKYGKLQDDNRRNVCEFRDRFEYADAAAVRLVFYPADPIETPKRKRKKQ